MSKHPKSPALTARAAAARRAIRHDKADPAVTLSYVVWPTAAIQQAQRKAA